MGQATNLKRLIKKQQQVLVRPNARCCNFT